MPGVTRFVISGDILQRYARSRLTVYGVTAACFILFFACIFSLQPSFPMLITIVLVFAIALVVGIMHNPLGLLTMRAQIKMGVREIAFDRQGLTVITLMGDAQRFDNPALELFYIPGPGGSDYYLQLKDENAKTGSFYLGNNQGEIEPIVSLLEDGGLRVKYEKAHAQREESLKSRYEEFFK